MTDMIGRCGFKCHACLAFKDNNPTAADQSRVAEGWARYSGLVVPPEKIRCNGCMAKDRGEYDFPDMNCPIAPCEIARATRYPRPLTILYIDLDNFKSVNDHLGHVTGDGVLKSVAHTITRSIRTIDSVARLGGDEFTVLLPETPDQAAKVIAPRLQQALLGEMRNNHWPVTFSIGALTCYRPPLDVQQLIKLADQLMYSVKNTSKDAIVYSVYTG
jgi:diguanylate cyclase (GGDEF)-like protein